MKSEEKDRGKNWCHARDVAVIPPVSQPEPEAEHVTASKPALAKDAPARLVKFNAELTERELIQDLKRQLQAASERIAQLEGK